MNLYDVVHKRFLVVPYSVSDFKSRLVETTYLQYLNFETGELVYKGRVLMRIRGYHTSHFELSFEEQGSDEHLTFLNGFLDFLTEHELFIRRIERKWYLIKLTSEKTVEIKLS